MTKLFYAALFSFLFCQTAFADFTIHILSPWANDTSALLADSLRMSGNSEAGYYPGASMYPEGGGWFYYTYTTLVKTDDVYMNIVDWIGPGAWQGGVSWSRTLHSDSLFAPFPATTNELWIDLSDTLHPKIYAVPPHSKVIYFFNPWPDNSSQIAIDNRPPMKMQMRTDICGWYTCYFVGPPDSLDNVYFSDYFHTQKYASTGLVSWLVNTPPMDLRSALLNKDTAYILPSPYPYGPPLLSATFPGQTGDCGLRKVSAKFRDWKFDANNPMPPIHSFFDDPMGAQYQVGHGGRGMVQTTLQPPDYIPQLTPAAVASDTCPPVSSWYQTDTFPNSGGRTNDTCIDLTLKKGDDGRWTFNSDDMDGFFPLDSFNDPNNIKYFDRINATDPTGRMRNFHFSMEMHLQFMYYRSDNLVFDFCGDDDVWIFVNNHLAVDLGGLNNRATDTMIVNKRNDSLHLGLVDGVIYNMDIFYAERNPVGSNLIIQTTMNLSNTSSLFYSATILGPGHTQYIIQEHQQSQLNSCESTPLFSILDTPKVNFFIQGPQFAQPLSLPPGNYFNNGLTVDPSKSKITLDSATLDTSLLPGSYRISFTSTFDTSRTGYLVFIVPPLPANHLDIIDSAVGLNPTKDAVIDSIYLPMGLASTQVYAVLRDKNGNFISTATGATWTSRDPTVVTITPLPGDKSHATITKTGTGTTWIVVSQAGLMSDSVKVSAIAFPPYPIISSAIMLDTNADIIPDKLSITLNDTFHTNQNLDSVVITYHGKNYTVLASNTALNGKTLSVPFPGTFTDAGPSGTVAIFMNVSASEKSYSTSFTDGVGPAITAASVLENDGSNPDVLYVTFSEPVTPASLTGNQILLMSAGATDTVALSIASFINTANDSVVTLTLAAGGKHPLAGDRVRLVPGSKGGIISDQSANTPSDLNQSVVLGFKPGPTSIVSAYYRDGNADGFIDTVVVSFKRPVPASSFQMLNVKWTLSLQNVKTDTIVLNTLKALNDSTYYIPVHGELLTPVRPRTSVGMELFATYTNFPDVPPRSTIVADSAAPVLVDSARLVYGASADSTLLTVTFSENVAQPGTHPFYLMSRTYGKYQAKLTPISMNGAVCVFRLDTIDAGTAPYGHTGDSVWINTDTLPLVIDLIGNAQHNPLNHKVPLVVITQAPAWNFSVVPNPFIPGPTSGNFTVISAFPNAPMVDADQYSLSISIFDIIGNQVITMPMQPSGKGWKCSWDHRNRNARLVGSGVYSAIITYLKNGGVSGTKRVSIGVQR